MTHLLLFCLEHSVLQIANLPLNRHDLRIWKVEIGETRATVQFVQKCIFTTMIFVARSEHIISVFSPSEHKINIIWYTHLGNVIIIKDCIVKISKNDIVIRRLIELFMVCMDFWMCFTFFGVTDNMSSILCFVEFELFRWLVQTMRQNRNIRYIYKSPIHH